MIGNGSGSEGNFREEKKKKKAVSPSQNFYSASEAGQHSYKLGFALRCPRWRRNAPGGIGLALYMNS